MGRSSSSSSNSRSSLASAEPTNNDTPTTLPPPCRGGALVALAWHSSPEHHHHHHSKPHFRNVKARVGSQYQTKVPKYQKATMSSSSSSSRRPAPTRLSKEYPWMTEEEQQQEKLDSTRQQQRQQQVGAEISDHHDERDAFSSSSSSSPPAAGGNSGGRGNHHHFVSGYHHHGSPGMRWYDPPPTRRGGLCIHRPSQTDTAAPFLFLARTRPLFGMDSSSHTDNDSMLWKSHMLERYGPHALHNNNNNDDDDDNNDKNDDSAVVSSSSAAAAGRCRQRKRPQPRRGDRKRKRSPEHPQPSQASWAHSSSSSSSFHDSPPSDEDANMLEYLTVRHEGDADAAQLALLVAMSAGRATKARRILQREVYATRFRRPPLASSQSWMLRFERMYPDLLGDLRPNPSHCAYPYSLDDNDHKRESSSKASMPKERNVCRSNVGIVNDDDDEQQQQQDVWRAVLSCSQEMERELRNNYKEGTPARVGLTDIMSLVQRAHALPSTPEDAFGPRHIVVERISESFHDLLDFCSRGRDVQAKLMDMLYDESGEGVDMEAVQKYVDQVKATCPVRLDEVETVTRQLELVADWNARVDAVAADHEEDDDVDSNGNAETNHDDDDDVVMEGQEQEEGHRNDLAAAEALAVEGVTKLAFVSKRLVTLEKRIARAHRLGVRIREWKESKLAGKKQTVKFVAGLVREANRVNLTCPEVSELITFHRTVEDWVERATIAIRSRISLTEIESLIERAESMPMDLSEYLEKLKSRRRLARSWINELEELVPRPCRDGAVDSLEWMSGMRKALEGEKQMTLLDMASEGTRIPVEMDCVKMLLTEIDAKNWSAKAKKWIPEDGSGGKRGKLEDLRDHLEKANGLREKLTLLPEQRQAWTLDGEEELLSILDAADDWFIKYREYLQYDNRRTGQERTCLSMQKLRQIVEEGNSIHANIGSMSNKMTRILSQAETWHEQYSDLLIRCGVLKSKGSAVSVVPVTLEEIANAVNNAQTDVSLDLDEARQLKALGERIKKWEAQVENAAPKRSKRVGKGRYSRTSRYSLDDLIALIDESKNLPIKTDEVVHRLTIQLEQVQSWRTEAQKELREIMVAFTDLRRTVDIVYDAPNEFYSKESRGTDEATTPTLAAAETTPLASSTEGNEMVSAQIQAEPEEVTEMSSSADDASQSETASISASSLGAGVPSRLAGGGSSVHKMISTLLLNARLTGVYTAEEEAAEILEKVSKWLVKSLAYIDAPKEVYNKKTFGSFDRFVQSGLGFLDLRESFAGSLDAADSSLIPDLISSWGSLVSDQLVRLKKIQSHRNEFIEWCKTAQNIIVCRDKRITPEDLEKLCKQSFEFPLNSSIVEKVRNLAVRVRKWTESAKEFLESDQELMFDEARALFEEGEKLNITCNEMKTLRNSLRSARGWLNKAKKCKIDQGTTHVTHVQALLTEYSSLLLSMPDEVSRLQQALRGYCICRRPYEGLMIGCDGCSEWFHGTCIGLSESRADKCTKYLCVRCSVKKAFINSSEAIVAVIRKWTSDKDLKKARQGDAQKHQRRVRKEKRDIEKLQEKIAAVDRQVSDSKTTDLELAVQTGEEVAAASDVPMVEIQSESQTVASSQPETDSGGAESSVAKGNVDLAQDETTSEEDGKFVMLQRNREAIKACEDRLVSLDEAASRRAAIEAREDEKREILRTWCIRVRSTVIIPSTLEQAGKSRPSVDGSLSMPMMSVQRDADCMGIADLPDVETVRRSFRFVAWCCQAMHLLARRPNLSDMASVVKQGASIKVPAERALRIMKSMLNRATQWQSKVERALAAQPGESQPVGIDVLKDLVASSDGIPFDLVDPKARLLNVIDDKGTRYCICGGPHVGAFMVGCDKCDRWFHGQCVGLDKETADASDSWMCPTCRGCSIDPGRVVAPMDLEMQDDSDDATDSDSEDSIGPHVPLPEKLWPPFGLFGSEKASEVLGPECCLVEDRMSSLQEASLATGPPAPLSSGPTVSIRLQTASHVNMEAVEVTASNNESTEAGQKSHATAVELDLKGRNGLFGETDTVVRMPAKVFSTNTENALPCGESYRDGLLIAGTTAILQNVTSISAPGKAGATAAVIPVPLPPTHTLDSEFQGRAPAKSAENLTDQNDLVSAGGHAASLLPRDMNPAAESTEFLNVPVMIVPSSSSSREAASYPHDNGCRVEQHCASSTGATGGENVVSTEEHIKTREFLKPLATSADSESASVSVHQKLSSIEQPLAQGTLSETTAATTTGTDGRAGNSMGEGEGMEQLKDALFGVRQNPGPANTLADNLLDINVEDTGQPVTVGRNGNAPSEDSIESRAEEAVTLTAMKQRTMMGSLVHAAGVPSAGWHQPPVLDKQDEPMLENAGPAETFGNPEVMIPVQEEAA